MAGCGGGGGREAQASGSCFWEMGWVEQVWKRRHVQVGRQLGSHEFEESVGDAGGDAQGVRMGAGAVNSWGWNADLQTLWLRAGFSPQTSLW